MMSCLTHGGHNLRLIDALIVHENDDKKGIPLKLGFSTGFSAINFFKNKLCKLF